MRSKEENQRRRASRDNFIKMAMEKGVPKSESAIYFDNMMRVEASLPEYKELSPEEQMAKELNQ